MASSSDTPTINQLLINLLRRGLSLPSAQEGLAPDQEILRGGLRPTALSAPVGYPLSGDLRSGQNTAPSARFVGPLRAAALFNASTPSAHPQRNRRLIEERLFWGWEVGAEGTDGSFPVDEITFDTGGVDVSAIPVADHRLVFLHETGDDVGGLGVWPLLSAVGTELTLTIDGPDAPNPAKKYTWQLVKPSPLPLLPVTSTAGPGGEVLYLTRKPDEWPAVEPTLGQPVFRTEGFVTGDLAPDPVTGLYVLTGGSPYAGAVGDYLYRKAGKLTFRVREVASPGPNDVVLEPLWDVIVNQVSGTVTLDLLYTVGEIAALGASASMGLGSPQGLFSFPELVEAVRTYPLISPMDGPPEVRPYGQELVLDPPTNTFRTQFNLGYRLTLFPADALGEPDLTRPLVDLESLVINPNLPADEPQSVTLDYATGALLLSHPIPETGGDLNPSGFVDGNGQRRLFAMFASFNRPSAATGAATSVVSPEAGHSGSGLFWTEAFPTGANVADRGPQWVFRLPEARPFLQDQYHPAPQPETGAPAGPTFPALTFGTKAGLGPVGYPKMGFQWRSPSSGLTAAGGLLYGRLNPSDSPNQVVVLPAATAASFDNASGVEAGVSSTGQPWASWQDGWKETILDVSASVPITLGVNDELRLTLNDLPLLVTLPPTILPPTAIQVVAALDAAIFAAAAAYGIPQTDGVTFQTDVVGASNQQVRIRARDGLYWADASGHANLVAPVNTRVQSLEFIQAFGSGATGRSQWEIQRLNLDADADASWTGRDVNLQGGPSLRGAGRVVESAYAPCVLEGLASAAGLPGFVDVAGGRVFLDAGLNGDVEGREVVIDPVSLDFNGQGGNLYYIFYDRDLGEVRYQGLPLLDPTFRGGPPTGISLARVLWDGLSFEYIIDARVFPTQRLQNGVLTVGTGGMFAKLHSAMWWIIEHPETVREVHLVSDVVVDYAQREQVYVPDGVTLQGNGYMIQANNFGAGGTSPRSLFVFADPFGDQATRNIVLRNFRVDVTGTGAQEITLFHDGGSSPPAAVAPVVVEDVSITHAGALTEFYAGLLVNYLGSWTLRRVFMQAGARLSHWVQSLASGNAAYPSGLDFTIEGGSVLGALPQLSTSSMFWTGADTQWVIKNFNGEAAPSANPFNFWYASLSSVRSRLYAERVTAYVGVGAVLRVNAAAVSAVRSILRLTDCDFSTEDDGQELLGGPIIRDLDVTLTRVRFNRVTPLVGGVAGAGVNWGTVAGSSPSLFEFAECELNNVYWRGSPGTGARIKLSGTTLSGTTGFEANSSTGLGASLVWRDVILEDGYLLINSWTTAQLEGCTMSLTSPLGAPMVRLAAAEVRMRDSRLIKTSTDTQAVVQFQGTGTIFFQAADLYVIHGSGLTGSPYGFRADATTIGANTLAQVQLTNLSSLYLGSAASTGAAALFFPDRGALTSLNLHLVNYSFQGYDSIAPVHYGLIIGTLYRRANVVGGIAVNRVAGAVTQFSVDGSVVDYFAGDSARFIDP